MTTQFWKLSKKLECTNKKRRGRNTELKETTQENNYLKTVICPRRRHFMRKWQIKEGRRSWTADQLWDERFGASSWSRSSQRSCTSQASQLLMLDARALRTQRCTLETRWKMSKKFLFLFIFFCFWKCQNYWIFTKDLEQI